PGGTLDPLTIPKYQDALPIPSAMPKSKSPNKSIDYYEIAVRQFQQQVLPKGMPNTTVWGYGSITDTKSFSYPARTIEATWNKAVRVKWINDLKDPVTGNYLPHLLPVDQTLHWANPPGGIAGRDMAGDNQTPYTGPVPIITHLHGAHVTEDSDGYPTAWYLPNANNIPAGYATVGSMYDANKAIAEAAYGQAWTPGSAVFQYPNDQRATTLWYHDHTMGMTRNNVYAGPAGFYLIRGGPDDLAPGILPSGAYEIPMVIQDKSFNADGSLFYPDNRAFFEGLTVDQLRIPFAPDTTLTDGTSDVSPIWNPEFFGNTIVANGKTWPYLNVQQRRYRIRLLNASDSRFLILKLSNGGPFWQIGSDGGFLPAPVQQSQLLIAPAERADIIIDFTNVPAGTNIILQNVGPDEPFGGGQPGIDFAASNPDTTGQVMQFRVVARKGNDATTPPDLLQLPLLPALPDATNTRQVSLNEEESSTVFVKTLNDDSIIEWKNGVPFGPTEAVLGAIINGVNTPHEFADSVTENPALNATELWEIHNFTVDAHPIHVHLVQFQVVEREDMNTGAVLPPDPGEVGYKDTVIAYPGFITRIKARFDIAGLFLWHCHILSHEDNEMMRPYQVGP
ncbi:MAG: multicopper oxidase domain-containing protein, partial [Chloroflexi bacterium]|nr:multicopper oxidase domain-containing protein [Chloroflexota bacterium]